MNFLAHLYLSGENVHVRLGNFIGDHVKGRAFTRYPADVQKGILLHRAIDSFTDSHLATAESKRLLRGGYGKYAGVVVDVFYDHLLASKWNNFSPFPLRGFTRGFYYQMVQNYRLLPVEVKRFLPFLIQNNRLYSYRTREGLQRALEIMSSITSLPSETLYSMAVLTQHYADFEAHFCAMFPDMIRYVANEFAVYPVGFSADMLPEPCGVQLKQNE
ncbi:MAG: DUF479 domain-containing protein [Bacteroidales bacterium]|nr:DUF479 domain-containing protein [Bacteroidales bacterium]MBN2749659.1 DUF479 domain-containing protein [Bacteroidales bacterium]